jgi:filamentous hemagglutinin
MHPNRVICLYIAALLAAHPPVHAGAGIRADECAPAARRPGLDSAPNGVPLVNIAPPTDRGISHNRYNAFNVSPEGLILNNSRTTVQTRLGGFVPGNANLSNGEARLILNEVAGTHRSSLQGYTEVAGRAAEVVIANPYGITCNGCGFINTPRATLTTGRPELLGGELSGFDVQGGDVTLQGAGLNAGNVDRVDIIARTVELNARLYAQDLSITTGPNRVDYQTLAATPRQGNSNGPSLSLDVSALGGMYAERIRLVGTEQGVGVNMPAELAAGSGGLQITADGSIRLGHSVSQGDVAITSSSGDIQLGGTLYSAQSLDISAREGVRTGDGLVGAQHRIGIRATSLDNDNALIVAGLDQDGTANAQGKLVIDTSGQISNRGTLLATESASLRSRSLDNADLSARIVSLGGQYIDTEHLDNGSGQIQARGDLAISANEAIDNRSGDLRAGGRLHMRAQGPIDNRSGRVAAGKGLQINSQGEIQNRGGQILSEGTITLGAEQGSIDNTEGDISAAEKLTLSAAGDVANASGTLSSGQTLSVHTGGGIENQTGRIEARGPAALTATDTISNRGGVILATDELNVASGQGGLENTQGLLTTAGGLSVTTREDMDNTEGLLGASGSLLVQAGGDLHNLSGRLITLGDATLLASHILNEQGEILAEGRLDLSVQGFANSGAMAAAGGLAITSAGAIVNGAGLVLYSAGDVSLNAGTAVTNLGTISTAGRITLDAATLSNDAEAQVFSAGDGVLNVNGAIDNRGRIHAARDLSVLADSVTNSASLSAAQDLRVETRDLTNRGILFAGRNMAQFTRGTLSNRPGATLLSMGDLAIAADPSGARTTRVLNESAAIEAYDGTLRISAMELVNKKEAFAIGTHTVSQTTVKLEPDTLRYTEDALLAIALAEHPQLDESDLKVRECDFVSGCGPVQYSQLAQDLFADILKRKAEPYVAQGYEVIQGLYSGPVLEMDNPEAPFYLIGLRIPDAERYERTRWITTTIEEDLIEQDAPAGKILSGRDLQIDSAIIRNDLGLVAANGDIELKGDKLENTGRDLVRTYTKDITRLHRDKHLFGNDDKWYTYGYEEGREVIHMRHGTIQAGGRVTGDFIAAIDNLSMRQDGDPIGLAESTSVIDTIGTQPKGGEGTTTPGLEAKWLPLARTIPSSRPTSRRVFDPTMASGLELPEADHGLFVSRLEVDHPYLVETNPQFTQFKHLLGSDYLLERLGVDPGQTLKRVGDGLYESRLVRDAVFGLTGRRYLGTDIGSDTAQLRYLMDNAVQAHGELDLRLGVRLSPEQIDALTRDIVWLEDREVAGQHVLVPVVYLAGVREHDLDGRGAQILARDIALSAEGGIDNSGALVAAGDLSLRTAGDLNNLGGILRSGENLTALAHSTIRNRSGSIRGGRLTLMARDGDVINERSTREIRNQYTNGTIEHTVLGDQALMEAAQTVTVAAGRDVLFRGAGVSAGDDLDLAAGRDIRMEATVQARRHGFDLGVGHDRAERTINLGPDIWVAGSLRLSAARDITLSAAQLEGADDVIIDANRDVRVLAAKDRESSDLAIETRDLLDVRAAEDRSDRETVVGTRIQAGRDLLINAARDDSGGLLTGPGRDVDITGASLAAGRDAVIYAGEDLSLRAEPYRRLEHHRTARSGVIAAQQQRHTEAEMLLAGTALHAAGDALLLGGRDVQVHASDIQAGRDVTLAAGMDEETGSLHVRAGTEANTVIDETRESELDLRMSDGLLSLASDTRRLEEYSRETNRASTISAGRDIGLTALTDLHVVGSRTEAARNARLEAGRELNMLAATQASIEKTMESETRVGVGATLNLNESSLFAGALTRRDEIKRNTRLSAASEILAGNDLRIEAGHRITQLGSDISAGGDIDLQADQIESLSHMDEYRYRSSNRTIRAGIEIGVEQHLSDVAQAAWGITQSASNPLNAAAAALKTVDTVDSTIMHPVSAGVGLVTQMDLSESESQQRLASTSSIDAGGDIRTIAGDKLHLQGTRVSAADDIILRSAERLVIDSAQGTSAQDGKTSHADIDVGLFGTKLGEVNTSANRSTQENAQIRQDNARITAANRLRIESGTDTTVSGAVLTARHIDVEVGGDLHVASRQDTGRIKGKHRDLDATTNGGGSSGRGMTSGKSAWVDEQTRISSTESLTVSVGQHTTIDGAVIASRADNLRLETGTLTYQDIRDQDKNTNKYLNLGSGHGGKLEASYNNQDREQITRATIAAGTIIARDAPNRDLSDLNRDLAAAQEITRDHSDGLDLYGSRGSVTKIASPTQTLQDWKTEEALSGIKMYQEVRENLPESETLETLSTLTGGLTPSRDSHGGVITQPPALVFGDVQFFKAVARLKERLEQEGRSIYELSKYEILYRITAPEKGTSVAANGIQNSLNEALRNGAMQTGDRDLSMAYNPEHGMIGDLLESGWDKIIGGVVASGNARQLRTFLHEGADNGYTGRVAAHSQGGLLVYRALDGSLFDSKNGDIMFQFNGTPIRTEELENAVNRANGKWTGHNINDGDPVANVPIILGGNAKSSNELVDSISEMPNLFDSTKSPHSNYFCTADFCAGKQPALR